MYYNSWEIFNDFVAIKTSDISLFRYKGSGVPIESRYFWEAESLKPKERKNINLVYKNKEYNAYIQMEESGMRTRMFWFADLHNIILERYPDYESFTNNFPLFKFTKNGSDKYEIDFMSELVENTEENHEVYEIVEGRKEGKQKFYYSTKYERDLGNRNKAIELHGLKCKVCDFDFQKMYGDIGNGYIEIHHLKPLSSLVTEIIVNPKTDLVPVCSNCHRMIHRIRFKTYSIQEIKNMIKENKK